MKSIKPARLLLWVACILLLASCAHQPSPDTYDSTVFFSGRCNDLTLVFSLIGHLFDDTIRTYTHFQTVAVGTISDSIPVLCSFWAEGGAAAARS